ncbi:MAG: hypothetical protein ACLQVN_15825 [Bryobacteraceae bacterium]
MLIYPQLTSGALTQYQIVKMRQERTIQNTLADGSVIRVADPAGAAVQWKLQYTALSEAERQALEQFFAAAAGTLNAFTFLDPAANLLAWSEDLGNAVWSAAPQLAVTGEIQDPKGGTTAWQLRNTGAGAQTLTQVLNVPTTYTYTFSVYLSAAQATTATLLLGGATATVALSNTWRRYQITGSGNATATYITLGVEVPAGAVVSMFGPQAEAQQTASIYQTATNGGVYEHARLRDDLLAITTTGVNRHSATVNVVYYANNL